MLPYHQVEGKDISTSASYLGGLRLNHSPEAGYSD